MPKPVEWTPMMERVDDLLRRHHVGAENAITAARLAKKLSVQGRKRIDARDVRDIVSSLRVAGAPIASSCGKWSGFFVPKNMEEAVKTVDDMRARARKVYLAAAGVLRGLLAEFGPQLELSLKWDQALDQEGLSQKK